MRVLLLIALVGCSTSDGPTGFATFSDGMGVISARATTSNVFYGAPFAAWTVSLAAVDGCGSTDTEASVEIDLLPNGTSPSGAIPIRADMTPTVLPSAFLRYGAETATTGTITIDSLTTSFMQGEMMVTTNAGDLMATFDAPLCH